MFWNFLKLTFREFKRYKGYAFINVAGLTIGLAVTALIMLWVVDELSFDRFHEHSRRIHRVGVDFVAGTHMTLVLSMPALAEALVQEFPKVENAARISRPERAPVKYQDKEFQESHVCYGDGSLFQIFSFPFISGNPKTALKAPYSVVITRDMAAKYFGDEDPLGKILKIDGVTDYIVTGVVENVPPNSHFRFHMVRSFETLYSERREDMENWLNIQYYTYLLLAEGADPVAVERKLPSVIDQHLGEILKSIGGTLVLFLQPLTKIHLHSRISGEIAAQGNITYVYLFTGIALFVLLMACINFINLATARSSSRALEIGIRKTIGSSRRSLVTQFLGESVFFSLISFLLAVMAISSLEPWFESLIGRPLSVSFIQTPWLLLAFVGLALSVGILSGSYPAFYLSAFRPVQVMKSGFSGGNPKSFFRNALVVFQFSISILLIIGTITVYRQVHFMKTKDLGFEEEHVLVIPEVQHLLRRMSFANARDELLKIPGVLNVAGSALVPTRGVQYDLFYPEGFTREEPQKLTRLDIEPQFIPTMEIEVISGRNFSAEFSTDPSASVLINETCASHFGWTDPLGKTFTFYPSPGGTGEVVVRKVIGLVKDFHSTSLHRRIEPLVLTYNPDRIRFLSARIIPENISRTVKLIIRKWTELEPSRPFDYFFLDASFDSQYRAEERVGILSFFFSLLAVFIGSLGLFGLTAYMTEKRTKEIGIRKVLGASATAIVRMLSGEFLRLVLMANLLAWPTAYFGLSLWLRNFPYRLGIEWLVMGAAGILTLAIALATMSFQAVKAALADPVEALKYE